MRVTVNLLVIQKCGERHEKKGKYQANLVTQFITYSPAFSFTYEAVHNTHEQETIENGFPFLNNFLNSCVQFKYYSYQFPELYAVEDWCDHPEAWDEGDAEAL